MRAQFGCIGRGLADQIGDEAAVAGVLTGDDGGLVDAGMGEQGGFDLAGLDAEAADLHLMVDAAQIIEVAIGGAARQIAGAIEPLAGAERVGHEAFGGEAGAAEIAAREAGTADMHLAGDAERGRLALAVEHMELQVGNRRADRAGAGGGGQVGDPHRPEGDMHGGLGDAVHVDELRPGVAVALEPGGELGEVERLAAEDDEPQRQLARCGGVGADQLGEGGGRLVQHGDGLARQQRVELLGRAADPVRHDHQASAMQQRAEQLPDREVEREGVEQGPHVVRPEGEPGIGSGEQPGDTVVRHQGALGAAGGAGGVDHISKVERIGAAVRRCRGLAGDRRRIGVEPYPHGVALRQQAGERVLDDQHRGAGVRQHVGEAVGRETGIERQVGAAGLEDGEQGDHHLGRALGAEADHDVGADAAGAQVMGEAVGAALEFAVAEGLVRTAQRHGIGRARRLLGDQLVQAAIPAPGGAIGRRRDQLAALRRIERRQRGQRARGVGDQPAEQAREVADHPGDGVGGEPIGIVDQAQRQRGAQRHLQGERIVGALDRPHLGDADGAGDVGGRRHLGRIVLERHDAVEQRRAGRQLAAALHLGQRTVLVLDELGLARLHGVQPVGDRLARRDQKAQRQGVDEQADGALHVRQLGRAARDGDAEHHLIAIGVAGEQQRPGALHQGVDGQLVVAGEALQLRQLDRHRGIVLRIMAAGGRGGGSVDAERGRGRDAGEALAPPPLCGGHVLALQPADIVAERAHRGKARRLAPAERGIGGEHLVEQHRERPAVEQDVMAVPDQPPFGVGDAHQMQAHQGRRGEIEAARAVLRQQRGEPLVLLGR